MGEGTGEGNQSVEEEWSRFREKILEVVEEVYWTRRIREGMERKGTE